MKVIEGDDYIKIEIPPDFFREFKPIPELVPYRTKPFETFKQFLARRKREGTDWWSNKCRRYTRR